MKNPGKIFIILFALILLASLILLNYFPLVIFCLLALTSVLIILSFYPDWGIYLTAFSLPFINWNISISSVQFSVTEAITLLALLAWLINYLISKEKKSWSWPLIIPFGAFVLVGILSAFLNPYIMPALYYQLRWVIFLYAAYIFYPTNVIRDGTVLRKTLIALLSSVLLMTIFGLASLFFQDWSNSFLRVQPIAIFGLFPYGYNHNLLAEFLVVGAFIPLALKYWFDGRRFARVAHVLSAFIAITALATFSRAAWLSLFVAGVAWFIVLWRSGKLKEETSRRLVAGMVLTVLILTPLFYKMSDLQSANTSSTDSRLLLSQIAWKSFMEKPLFGHGPGNFISLVGDSVRFQAKYGEPLDSHGIWQKIIAELGFLGFISFSALLFVIFRKIYKGLLEYQVADKLLYPLAASALAVLFFQFFNTSYYKGKMWFPIILPLIAISLLAQKKYAKGK